MTIHIQLPVKEPEAIGSSMPLQCLRYSTCQCQPSSVTALLHKSCQSNALWVMSTQDSTFALRGYSDCQRDTHIP